MLAAHAGKPAVEAVAEVKPPLGEQHADEVQLHAGHGPVAQAVAQPKQAQRRFEVVMRHENVHQRRCTVRHEHLVLLGQLKHAPCEIQVDVLLGKGGRTCGERQAGLFETAETNQSTALGQRHIAFPKTPHARPALSISPAAATGLPCAPLTGLAFPPLHRPGLVPRLLSRCPHAGPPCTF